VTGIAVSIEVTVTDLLRNILILPFSFYRPILSLVTVR